MTTKRIEVYHNSEKTKELLAACELLMNERVRRASGEPPSLTREQLKQVHDVLWYATDTLRTGYAVEELTQ